MHVSLKGPATYYSWKTKSLYPKVCYVNFFALPILLLSSCNVDEVGHDGVAYDTVFLDIRKPEHSKESHARQNAPQGHV